MNIQRGQIVWIDFQKNLGSKQGGLRPCIVIQNNVGNRFAPTVIVAAVTSVIKKPNMPTHVVIDSEYIGIKKPSMVLLEQLDTVDKCEIVQIHDVLSESDMQRVDKALKISLEVC